MTPLKNSVVQSGATLPAATLTKASPTAPPFMAATFAKWTSASATSAPARLPSHTSSQLPNRDLQPIRPDAFAHTRSTLPVNSSAPQHSTSTSPRQKQSPPTARCTANGMEGSPRNTQKYSAPNAMNAPASIADAKHFAFGMAALASPTFSAFSAISAGDSASGLSVWISSCIMIASGSFLAWSRLLRASPAKPHGMVPQLAGAGRNKSVFLDNFPISSSCSSHRRIDTRPSVHRRAQHWYTLASGRVGRASPHPCSRKAFPWRIRHAPICSARSRRWRRCSSCPR